MKETSGRRENDPELLIIIIRSARRNNNIFGIHHPPQRNVLFIPCWSRRSPILWLSTSGYGWPFAVWLLSSRGSAFHQRHLWDCEHVPQKKKQSKSLGFDRIYVWEKEKKKESMRENDRIIRKKCGLAQTSPKKWTSNDVKKKKKCLLSRLIIFINISLNRLSSSKVPRSDRNPTGSGYRTETTSSSKQNGRPLSIPGRKN